MAVNTAITFLRHMKIHYLIESEQESAEREAVIVDKLYRGIDGEAPSSISRVPIRQDRIPRDATFPEHIIFCAAFEKIHGIPDVRAKALFCTTEYTVAVDYGDAIVSVYPLKTAKLAYAPHYNDSGSIVSSLCHHFWRCLADELKTDVYKVGNMLVNRLGDCPFLDSQDPLNCTTQLTQFIQSLDKVAPGLSARMFDVFNKMSPQLGKYVIVPGTEIASISPEVEVMVLDAPYYYAKLAKIPGYNE